MKMTVPILIVVFGLFSSLAAQEPVVRPAESKPATPDVQPNRPPRPILSDRSPARAEPATQQEITQSLLRQFSQARHSYLAKQNDLRKALETANEQQRKILRNQLRILREEQTQARAQMRQELLALRERLSSHRDLIDDAREGERDHRRRGD